MKPQTQLVLRHLEKYGSITPKEAYENYRIMRLAARVKELRRWYSILTTYESHGKSVHARYVL